MSCSRVFQYVSDARFNSYVVLAYNESDSPLHFVRCKHPKRLRNHCSKQDRPDRDGNFVDLLNSDCPSIADFLVFDSRVHDSKD